MIDKLYKNRQDINSCQLSHQQLQDSAKSILQRNKMTHKTHQILFCSHHQLNSNYSKVLECDRKKYSSFIIQQLHLKLPQDFKSWPNFKKIIHQHKIPNQSKNPPKKRIKIQRQSHKKIKTNVLNSQIKQKQNVSISSGEKQQEESVNLINSQVESSQNLE